MIIYIFLDPYSKPIFISFLNVTQVFFFDLAKMLSTRYNMSVSNILYLDEKVFYFLSVGVPNG